MEEELELVWKSRPYFLEFESCPIKLMASSIISEKTAIDEVMIYNDELWSKVSRYKGSNVPYT